MTIQPGQDLLHYRIVEKIGEGGMGLVWKAEDSNLGRTVAIKVLPETLADDPALLARFEQEARMVAALRHPNIVTIYSLERADGVRFLSMEFVDGHDLTHVLAERRPHPEQLCEILLPLTDALSAAHAAGVIHRDLKPSNVMLTGGGQVMLLDFGVAKLASEDVPSASAHTELTQPGVSLGTPRYMAPEQLKGQRVDARTDIFSLGILMYELATGRHPFEAGNPSETISAILRDSPPACGELEDSPIEGLVTVLFRCMEKEPQKRYQSAGELRVDLRALQESMSGAHRTESETTELKRGRTAFKNQDWTAAYEALSRAAEMSPLSPEDLELLAEVAFWTGNFDEGSRYRQLAYSAYLDADQPDRAGLMAIRLCEEFTHRQSKAVAAGWLKRAERLLSDTESREYGHLIRMRAKTAVEENGDLEQAIVDAETTFRIGREFGDSDLEAMGLADRGRAMVRLGSVVDGMALLDEAMALSSSGKLSPMTTGRIYCIMMATCQLLADYQRAEEWSEAAQNWCEPHADSGFPGICRVHRAGTLRLSGKWEEAEEQARLAQEQLGGYGIDIVAEALYEIGEIRLRRGDFEGAEASFSQAHEMGRDPVPGLAVLRLLQGKVQAAQNLLRRALDEPSSPLDRARLLPAWIDVSLEAGDRVAAENAASELTSIAEKFGSKVYEAASRHGLGICLLHAGEFQGAVKELRQAWRVWKELELPLEGAHSRLQLGRAYREAGDEEDASLELGAALSTFRKLGAEPSIRMAESLIAGE